MQVIDKMKSEFASDVFANPKDGSFASSVNQIYQTFDGQELYPTLEEKAAMLLYLITKNHSFQMVINELLQVVSCILWIKTECYIKTELRL